MSRIPSLPTWVSAVLGIAVCAQAGGMVVAWVRATRTSSNASVESLAVLPRTPRQAIDVAALANAHLFGRAISASMDSANAPATALSLVLAGVLAASDPSRGLAILGEAAKSAKLYLVGERVPGGALLHAVYTDRVVLERNGTLESLAFPRMAQAGGVLLATTGPAGQPSNAAITAPTPGSGSRPDKIPRVAGDIIATEAVSEAGQQRGFRIYPGPKRALFSMLGLAPGDLVTAIDGAPLTDASSGKAILSTLDSTSSAHFTVMRNGRELNLLVDLGAIAPRNLPEPASASPVEEPSDQ
jgi:general secretion pathway protein C